MAESIHPLNHKECCMCGDFGLPNALFRCRTCLFRSQHKYCSDLYPKAESYRICNWCLRDRGRKPTPITEDNPSANNGISNNGDGGKVSMKRKFIGFERRLSVHMHSIKKNRFMEINANKYPEGEMKTEVDGDHGMEMMVTKGGGKQELLRTKSEDLSNAKGGMMRQIGRGKVRRYKLLEEVSS